MLLCPVNFSWLVFQNLLWEAGRQPSWIVLGPAFGPDRLGERLGTGRNPSSPVLGQFVPLGGAIGWPRGGWSAVDLAA